MGLRGVIWNESLIMNTSGSFPNLRFASTYREFFALAD